MVSVQPKKRGCGLVVALLDAVLAVLTVEGRGMLTGVRTARVILRI